MARISNFTIQEIERPSVHSPIEGVIHCFEKDGRKLFQLNTMGSKERQIPGKVSQSIQLDEGAALQLYTALQKHFGFK